MMNGIKEYFSFCIDFYNCHPFLTGVVITLLGVLFFSLIAEGILMYRRARKVKFLSFEISSGTVHVSVRSIEGLVRMICKDFPEFNLGNIHLSRRKGNVILHLSVEYVYGGRNLLAASTALEDRIFNDLKSILGVDDVSRVMLQVRNSRTAGEESADTLRAVEIIPDEQ